MARDMEALRLRDMESLMAFVICSLCERDMEGLRLRDMGGGAAVIWTPLES